MLSEGQRGLLGVGYEPARVIATLVRTRRRPPRRLAPSPSLHPEDSPAAARVRALMARVVAGWRSTPQSTVDERDGGVTATVTGDDRAC